jgi:hypothetical protein
MGSAERNAGARGSVMRKVCSLAVLFCVMLSDPSLADSLGHSQVRALFPGRYQVRVMNTVDLTVNMQANGVVIGHAKGDRDTGRWSVEGGKLCIAWSKWNNSRKDCSPLSRQGNVFKGRGFWFQAA